MTDQYRALAITIGREVTSRITSPRLLPLTICLLALALMWRTASLVHSVMVSAQSNALITTAWASGPDTPTAVAPTGQRPGTKPAEPGQSAKPDASTEGKPAAEPSAQDGWRLVTDGEKAILLDLRQRRQELDAREAALSGRESMLTAAEKKLSDRVGELQSLQQRLEGLDASHRQQEDAALQGLVKVYETMKPRDAAAIFNDLGMPVLLSVVDRMKEAKAAAILAAMLPDKARDVTTQLAWSRTHAADSVQSGDKPALTTEPGKAPGSGT